MVGVNLPRSVPWSSWDEWDFVKQKIWSPDRQANIVALEIIAMWKVRGKIPQSIDSTASLMEVYLNDNAEISNNIGSSTRSVYEIQNNYALAVIRAVNGLVDPSQKEYAQSVYNIAIKIGLPGWIVELRHDSTHNKMPCLNLLRLGAKELLNWYKTNYWIAQQEYIQQLSILCIPDSVEKSKGFAGCNISPTMINDVFIPMLIQGTIYSKPANQFSLLSIHELAPKHFDYANSLIDQWSDKYFEIIEIVPTYRHSLIIRIIISGLDFLDDLIYSSEEINKLNYEQLHWSIFVIYLWVIKLLGREFDHDDIINPANMISAVIYRMNKIVDKIKLIGSLEITISYLNLISSALDADYNISDGSENSRKRKSNIVIEDEISNPLVKWKKRYDIPVWPLGLQIGFTSSNLYEIEEVTEESNAS